MSNIFVSVWFGLLRAFLTFLHLLYSGLQYFDLAWALFKRKAEYVFQMQVSDTELYVSKFVTGLEKCPSHLAVIVGTDQINVEDFSNIVIWCLAAGISFVTFYDHTGVLKDKETIYLKYLFNKRKVDASHVVFTAPGKNGFKKNGCLPKMHVNILCLQEGKELYGRCVEKLSKEVLCGVIKSSEINIQLLNNELNKLTNFPDPDVAIIGGDVCSTYGFLPWQIRVTEFRQFASLKEIQVSDFTDVLRRYSACHQRFGK